MVITGPSEVFFTTGEKSFRRLFEELKGRGRLGTELLTHCLENFLHDVGRQYFLTARRPLTIDIYQLLTLCIIL